MGVNIEYREQAKPAGIAQAFLIADSFIGKDSVTLILGDNIFYGHTFGGSLKSCTDPDGGIIFAYPVSDPERYGVVEFDGDMKAVSVEEKPVNPKSNYAIEALFL